MGSMNAPKLVMRRRTSINVEYIRETLRWQLQWTLGEIATAMEEQGGVGRVYTFRLLGAVRQNTTLDTLDALYNLFLARFIELGLEPPDDLWNKLLTEEWIAVSPPPARATQAE